MSAADHSPIALAEIIGPDNDHNGVRDDIDQYIDSLLDTPRQKAVLRQHARALTATMVIDPADTTQVIRAATKIAVGITCLFKAYNDEIAGRKAEQLEAISVNTAIRARAYERFDSAMSGKFISSDNQDRCSNS